MSSFAFVDTLPGVVAAHANGASTLGSDNPLLVHDPRAGSGIVDMSSYLLQPEATRLGRGAIDMLLALDEVLERAEASIRYGGRPGRLNVTISLRALLSTLIQRGIMAHRSLTDFGAGRLVLFVPDQPRWDARMPWNLPRFACVLRPLADAGFFDKRLVEHVPVAFDPPIDFNDTVINDLSLRVLLVPVSQVLQELARRLKLVGNARRGRIAIGKLSETLSETLPWLTARGLCFGKFKIPPYAAVIPSPFGTSSRIDTWLCELVNPVLSHGISKLGVFPDHATHAITNTVVQHLSAGLAGLGCTVQALNTALDDTFKGVRGSRILMTSGVYGPIGTQLHALCRERDIVLVDFEHGATTGIAHTADRRLQVSEATTSDVLMASSPRAARSFERAPCKADIKVIGLADQTRRVHMRPLQRIRARKHLGLKRGEQTVMHISTLLYGGNMRPGDDTSVEHYVYETESCLLTEVYGRVAKTVLYKPYPTQRFPHGAIYSDVLHVPPNVSLIGWADFRYMRAAADVIVTSANSSTIGWCIGADVPMIHLGSREVHALVDDELRDQFAQSFLTINMDAPNWALQLTNMLNRDLADLQNEWQCRRSAREQLLADGIFGPAGSAARRAARIVAELHGYPNND